MKISEMVITAFNTARSKGWWPQFDESGGNAPCEPLASLNVPEKLMLIVTEVAEAMEDYREGKMTETVSEKGKPGGFSSEMADVVIRVADLCGALGIDLEGAIERKMKFNATRSYKHGGKVC